MLAGRVMGMVVSTNKVDTLHGCKLLIVQPIELRTQQLLDDYVVCVDDVGAGVGDIVFCAYGSSSRQTDTTSDIASEYSIYGIIDSIDMYGSRVYDKAEEDDSCNWQE